TETTQELLRILAVGQYVDHATLGEVSGLPRAELVAALREGVASHLIVAQADDRYAFRHALLREVVADDLLPGERTELHRAFAEALERRAASGPAGAQLAAGIAHHYAATGDQRAALGASVPDAAEVAGMDQVALLHRAGDAFIAAGDRTRPMPLLRSALEMVDEETEPRR